MFRSSALLAVVVGALGFSGVASAATLTVPADIACYEQGQNVKFSGSGFEPDFRVGFTDSLSAYPDGSGTLGDVFYGVPETSSFAVKPLTITGTQVGSNISASVTVQTTRFGANLPVVGKPGAAVTWQFGGFPTGATIWGHFRFKNKKVTDFKFGKAAGPCGTLTKKAKRIPVKKAKRGGGWYVQIDTKKKFSFNTRPEFDKSFSIR